jgi:gluconolactonase
MADIDAFHLRPQDIRFLGTELSRPECVIAERDGTLWISDNRAAVTRLDPDGRQTLIGNMKGAPNGLALDRHGVFYIANIGDGKVYAMQRDGSERVICDSLEGKSLASVNFTYLDPAGRLWVTVSTQTEPRIKAVQTPIPDGYLFRIDLATGRAFKVLDGLHFTNEVRVDAAGKYLYIVETAMGRVIRTPLAADGSLGPREVYGPEPVFPGAKLDGIAFDAEGNLWATEVGRNSIVVITPAGRGHVVFEDPEAKLLKRPASIAFGGQDLRTAYIGSLDMDRLAVFDAPVPGLPMLHW